MGGEEEWGPTKSDGLVQGRELAEGLHIGGEGGRAGYRGKEHLIRGAARERRKGLGGGGGRSKNEAATGGCAAPSCGRYSAHL